MQLFLISLPLGAAYFAAFLWYLLRRE